MDMPPGVWQGTELFAARRATVQALAAGVQAAAAYTDGSALDMEDPGWVGAADPEVVSGLCVPWRNRLQDFQALCNFPPGGICPSLWFVFSLFSFGAAS